MITTTTIDRYLAVLIDSLPAGCAGVIDVTFRIPGDKRLHRAGFRAFAWPGGLVVARLYEN